MSEKKSKKVIHKAGSEHKIQTSRFGTCVGRIVKDVNEGDDFVEIEVISGELVGMSDSWGPGDRKGLRLSGTHFSPAS